MINSLKEGISFAPDIERIQRMRWHVSLRVDETSVAVPFFSHQRAGGSRGGGGSSSNGGSKQRAAVATSLVEQRRVDTLPAISALYITLDGLEVAGKSESLRSVHTEVAQEDAAEATFAPLMGSDAADAAAEQAAGVKATPATQVQRALRQVDGKVLVKVEALKGSFAQEVTLDSLLSCQLQHSSMNVLEFPGVSAGLKLARGNAGSSGEESMSMDGSSSPRRRSYTDAAAASDTTSAHRHVNVFSSIAVRGPTLKVDAVFVSHAAALHYAWTTSAFPTGEELIARRTDMRHIHRPMGTGPVDMAAASTPAWASSTGMRGTVADAPRPRAASAASNGSGGFGTTDDDEDTVMSPVGMGSGVAQAAANTPATIGAPAPQLGLAGGEGSDGDREGSDSGVEDDTYNTGGVDVGTASNRSFPVPINLEVVLRLHGGDCTFYARHPQQANEDSGGRSPRSATGRSEAFNDSDSETSSVTSMSETASVASSVTASQTGSMTGAATSKVGTASGASAGESSDSGSSSEDQQALFKLPLPQVTVATSARLGLDPVDVAGAFGSSPASVPSSVAQGVFTPDKDSVAVHVGIQYDTLEVSPAVFVFARQLLQEVNKVSPGQLRQFTEAAAARASALTERVNQTRRSNAARSRNDGTPGSQRTSGTEDVDDASTVTASTVSQTAKSAAGGSMLDVAAIPLAVVVVLKPVTVVVTAKPLQEDVVVSLRTTKPVTLAVSRSTEPALSGLKVDAVGPAGFRTSSAPQARRTLMCATLNVHEVALQIGNPAHLAEAPTQTPTLGKSGSATPSSSSSHRHHRAFFELVISDIMYNHGVTTLRADGKPHVCSMARVRKIGTRVRMHHVKAFMQFRHAWITMFDDARRLFASTVPSALLDAAAPLLGGPTATGSPHSSRGGTPRHGSDRRARGRRRQHGDVDDDAGDGRRRGRGSGSRHGQGRSHTRSTRDRGRGRGRRGGRDRGHGSSGDEYSDDDDFDDYDYDGVRNHSDDSETDVDAERRRAQLGGRRRVAHSGHEHATSSMHVAATQTTFVRAMVRGLCFSRCCLSMADL